MANWDTSFVRDGRDIAEWLPDLVSEDVETRHAAAEALGGMRQAMPRYSTRWDEMAAPAGAATSSSPDTVAQAARFNQAVREAVEQPGFPRAAFVRQLLAYRLALGRDRRLQKSESLQAPGMITYVVFEALDTALLEAPDLLHQMLDGAGVRSHAADALQRLGPAAAPFATRLLRELDAESRAPGTFDGARALGNIAATVPDVAAALVGRLRAGGNPVRAGAAAALEHAGPAALSPTFLAEAIGLLREMSHSGELTFVAVPALASLGREREDVLADLLAMAAPRPPRWRVTEGKYGQRYDEVQWERGVALEALRYFTAFPDRVVPVLVDAIETFEEYDPDWGYSRAEHGRVVESLRAFGPAAGALAAPVLARHLRQSDGDVDLEVVRLLGDIGPAASAALPALERLAAELLTESGPPDEGPAAAPPDRNGDTPVWAIWRLRGGT